MVKIAEWIVKIVETILRNDFLIVLIDSDVTENDCENCYNDFYDCLCQYCCRCYAQ